VWDLSDADKIGQRITMAGHTADVHCAKFLWPFLASGGEDKSVRLWRLQFSDRVTLTLCFVLFIKN
jgi:WD40 repeat protein